MKYDILDLEEKIATLNIDGSVVGSLKNTALRRFGVRRFEKGRAYQTSHVGFAGDEQLLVENREWGGPGLPHSGDLAPEAKGSRTAPVAAEGLQDSFEQEFSDLVRSQPDFVFNGKLRIRSSTIGMRSNYGLELSSRGGQCDFELMYQKRDSGNMLDGFIYGQNVAPDFKKIFSERADDFKALKHVVKLSSSSALRLPVLMTDPLAPLGKFGLSTMVNRYHEGACLYAGRLGENLFSPKINLVDSAYDPACGIFQFFDGDGVVRKSDELRLIDQGRFASLVSDIRWGTKFKHASTGNGLRAYNSGVNLGFRSLRFNGGTRRWREILRGLDRCLVVAVSAGGDGNDLGQYSAPVQVGYIYEHGELVGCAPQVTIRTTISNYLKEHLIEVSSDSYFAGYPGGCIVSEMDVTIN